MPNNDQPTIRKKPPQINVAANASSSPSSPAPVVSVAAPTTLPEVKPQALPAYELETGNVIVERFAHLNPDEMSAVLVHGHAPFVWGPSGAKAVETALALEIVAEMALKTLQANPAATPISPHLLNKHFKRKHGGGAYYGQPAPAK